MKTLQHVLTAGLVCGAMTFTACSDDSSSSPKPSANHTAFVENTRANMKVLAENLNFASWEYANTLNTNFNEHVLLNDDFQKSLLKMAALDILSTFSEVEKGSELDKLGYKYYFVIDFGKFNYQFNMNEDGTEFETSPADNFELLLTGYNPESKTIEKELYKISFDIDGTVGKTFTDKLGNSSLDLDGIAAIVNIPKNVAFDISVKSNKKWNTVFKGKFKNTAKLSNDSEFMDNLTTSFDIEGEISSHVPYTSGKKTLVDSTTFKFKIGQDAKKNKGSLTFYYEHNGKTIAEVTGVMTNDNGLVDMDQFTSSNSLLDILSAMMVGNGLEEFKMTLLGDLVINMKITDLDKFLQTQISSADARRNYTDKKTIEDYADQLNEVLTASLESKRTNQTIDVKFEATKFGVDYWTMPSFKFSDEKNYIPLVDLLDQETIIYGLNILDHTVEPLSEAIIVVRQLRAYFKELTGTYNDNQGSALNK